MDRTKSKTVIGILCVALFISLVSAAIFITYSPEATLFFTKENPNPEIPPIVSNIKGPTGNWAKLPDIGIVGDEPILIEMRHINPDASDTYAAVYFILECEQGLEPEGDGSGLLDIDMLRFTNPHGTWLCDNSNSMTIVSDTKVYIVPIAAEMTFPYNEYIYTSLEIQLAPMAYGNYSLTVWVEKKIEIEMEV